MFVKFNSLLSEHTLNEIRKLGKQSITNLGKPESELFNLITMWIQDINNIPVKRRKESVLESSFISKVLCECLGYSTIGSSKAFSLIPKDGTGNFPDLKGGQFTSKNTFFNVKPKFLIELKGPNCIDLKKPQSSRPDKKSPVQQVISDMFMEGEQCSFAVVTNMLDFEIYTRSFADKRYISFSLNELSQYDDLYLLFGLLSSESILMDSKSINVEFKNIENIKKSISKDFYEVFRVAREGVFKNINGTIADADSNHFVTKLLSQIIFIIYGESTGLIPKGSLENVLELGDYKWDNYRKFCTAMDKGGKISQLSLFGYNGGLFHPTPLFKKKFNKEVLKSISPLASFNFLDKKGNLLSVEDIRDILGRVLEYSLEINKEENLYNFTREGDFAEARKKQATRNKRQKNGAFYTKRNITKYMVERTIELMRLDKVNISKTKWLDPACGSGAFLVEMFDQLVGVEKAKVGFKDGMLEQKDSFKVLMNEIESNVIDRISGVDFDPLATGIAQLSISMKCSRPYEKLPLLSETIREADSLKEGAPKKPKYDVIIANPPYMRWEYIPKEYRDFLSKEKDFKDLAASKADYSAFFFKDAARKIKPNGYLTFIATNKLLSNAQSEEFRRWMSKDFDIVEIFDFRKPVFQGTNVETAIFILKKKKSAAQASLPYLDVFTYNKSDNHLEPLIKTEVSCDILESAPFYTIPTRITPEAIRVVNWYQQNIEKFNTLVDFKSKVGLRITDVNSDNVLKGKPSVSIKSKFEPLHDGTSMQIGTTKFSSSARWISKKSPKLAKWRSDLNSSNGYIVIKELASKPNCISVKKCPALLNSTSIYYDTAQNPNYDIKDLANWVQGVMAEAWMEVWFGPNRHHATQRWMKVYVQTIPYPRDGGFFDSLPGWVIKECEYFLKGEYRDSENKDIDIDIKNLLERAESIKEKAAKKKRLLA